MNTSYLWSAGSASASASATVTVELAFTYSSLNVDIQRAWLNCLHAVFEPVDSLQSLSTLDIQVAASYKAFDFQNSLPSWMIVEPFAYAFNATQLLETRAIVKWLGRRSVGNNHNVK